MTKKIFIYGVPGTGKTYYSKKLGKELNTPVIEGDTLRKNFRKGKPKKGFPLLYLGTCKAYKQFGELNEENAIKGLLGVREALNQIVMDVIDQNDDFILEAAFLDPKVLEKYGQVILMTTIDVKKHRRQFLHHREKIFDFKNNEFKAARIVQEYLIEEAKSLGVEIKD